MPEYTSVQREYARYRLDKVKEDLEAAKQLFDDGITRVPKISYIIKLVTILSLPSAKRPDSSQP